MANFRSDLPKWVFLCPSSHRHFISPSHSLSAGGFILVALTLPARFITQGGGRWRGEFLWRAFLNGWEWFSSFTVKEVGVGGGCGYSGWECGHGSGSGRERRLLGGMCRV